MRGDSRLGSKLGFPLGSVPLPPTGPVASSADSRPGLVRPGLFELGRLADPPTSGGADVAEQAPIATVTASGYTAVLGGHETATIATETGTGTTYPNVLVRVTQTGSEVLTEAPGTASVRPTQIASQVLVEAPATATVRPTQVASEVLVEYSSTIRETAPVATQSITASIVYGVVRIAGTIQETAPVSTIQFDGQAEFPGVSETAPVAQVTATGSNEFSGLLETGPVAQIAIQCLNYADEPAKPGVTQVVVEVARHSEQDFTPPKSGVTQAVVEYAHDINPDVIGTQAMVEYAHDTNPDVEVTQVVIEIAVKRFKIPVTARYSRAISAR